MWYLNEFCALVAQLFDDADPVHDAEYRRVKASVLAKSWKNADVWDSIMRWAITKYAEELGMVDDTFDLPAELVVAGHERKLMYDVVLAWLDPFVPSYDVTIICAARLMRAGKPVMPGDAAIAAYLRYVADGDESNGVD